MMHSDNQEDLDLYLQIFNTLAHPLFVKDQDHHFVMVNDAFCDLFRLTSNEFVGKGDDELFPESEWRVFREKDKKILTTGAVDENEEYVTIPGGRRLRVLTRKSLLATPAGGRYVLGVITDITEKVELHARIRDSRKKYKTIFNMGSDPTGLILYPEWQIMEANDASLKIAGLSRRSLIGKTADLIFTWVDPGEKERYFKTIERDKEVKNMEIRLRHRNGKVLSFLVSSKLLHLKRKHHLLYSMRNISDLKETETSLRDSRMMYREMVDYSPIPLLIHRQGTILFANDAAITFAGVPWEQLIGRKISDVLKIPRGQNNNKTLGFLFHQPSLTWESKDVLLETKEGVPRHFILRNTRINYGNDIATMTKVMDITEQENLEKYILNKILEAEENERKRYAADLHDDLGPLLSTMKFHIGLLEMVPDPQKASENLNTIESILNHVIRKVHHISHSISPHTISDYGLEGAVENFCLQVNEMGFFRIGFHHNIHNLRFPNDIELHYYRIILELLNNSMKYSGANGMSIDLQYRNGTLSLRYTDRGKGYRINDILQKSKGIGLSNIIHRVSLMNGDIRFLREKGKTVVVIRTSVAFLDH